MRVGAGGTHGSVGCRADWPSSTGWRWCSHSSVPDGLPRLRPPQTPPGFLFEFRLFYKSDGDPTFKSAEIHSVHFPDFFFVHVKTSQGAPGNLARRAWEPRKAPFGTSQGAPSGFSSGRRRWRGRGDYLLRRDDGDDEYDDDDDDEDGAEARVGKLVESSIIIQGSWRAEDGAEARVGHGAEALWKC